MKPVSKITSRDKKVKNYDINKIISQNSIKHILKEKVDFFQESILSWFGKNKRNFSWRESGLSNYQYIIAEVLLQRTKAETVAKFYLNFINEFPTWKSLVEADVKRIEEYLRPLGLYTQRSVRLKNLAYEMLKRNGKLPSERNELESIPFLGQYITNSIELIIFNKPSPLIDVNMARVLERFFGERKLIDIRYDPYLQELSYRIVEHENSKEINWAVLDFAAIVCKIKPLCNQCVLSKRCYFFQKNLQ